MLSKKEQKYIKSLKVKKYRMREKRFLVEGAKNVQELINSEYEVELIVATEEYEEINLRTFDRRVEVVKRSILDQLGTFKSNDTALAVVRSKAPDPKEIHFEDSIFILDGVSDPGNLGTIIRTLDWFGFNQLICSPDCAEFYNPKVINSTMGSFTRLKVFEMPLENFFKINQLPIYAADMNGQDLNKSDLPKKVAIIMGSESQGISKLSRSYMDRLISIPKIGLAESLNVGIATGILANHLRISK